MARISDAINQGLENLSTSPLGMASLGLLMQPSMSRTPINPWQYAAQGMQLGIQNRQARQQALAQQEQSRSAQEMQRARYLMEIQKYQQEEMRMRQAEEERARQAQAMQELMSTMDPKEAQIAAVLGPKYVEQMLQQRMQTGRLPAANIQEYEAAKAGGFQGSFMDYMNSKINRPVSPNYQAIPTAEGMQVFNTRTGRVEGTQGMPPAQFNPALQGQIAASRAEGTATGESTAASKLNLSSYLDSSEAMLSKVAELIRHPGMPAAVGAPSLGKAMTLVPGTEASNFMARLEEVKGGQFLEAFNTLKGGGAITQTEGQKATQAISRMSTSQDEKEFVTAANEFMDIVRKGMERAQAKASGSAPAQAAPSRTVNFEDLP